MISIDKEVVHAYVESPADRELNFKVNHGNSGTKEWGKDGSRQSYCFKFWTHTDLSTSLQFCQLETMSSSVVKQQPDPGEGTSAQTPPVRSRPQAWFQVFEKYLPTTVHC